MYNSERPAPGELPSSAQLLRSTFIALIAAII
ncbi:MAG: transmembrane anchor protein, partial [Pseudomonadota bacterium]